jgi:hypothetical protein
VNELTAEEAKAKFEATVAQGGTTGDLSKEAPPVEVKEPYYRFTTVTYSDTEGRIITALMPTDPTIAEPKFIGTVRLQTQRGPYPIQFGLEGLTIDEAFDSFDTCAQKAVKEIEAESKKPKLLVPGQQNNPNVIQGAFGPK